jgi:dinuclear metal center YbgI/SA1388 family protein
VSHHPLLFKGLKQITGATSAERIVAKAIRHGLAIYSAHTNLDSAFEGVSYEMAHALSMKNISPLIPTAPGASTGLGIIGEMQKPVPAQEFLRMLKHEFSVKSLRYSIQSPKIVIRKVALCGGSGASFITDAINADADAYVCGDIKYHDFDSYGPDILLADIGHYESEVASKKILARIIKEKFPNFVVYFAETENNPVGAL